MHSKKLKYWELPGYKCCDACGKRYFRSNSIRLWTAQNPGHRMGWIKEEQKLCTSCVKAKDARAILHDINPQWTTKAT